MNMNKNLDPVPSPARPGQSLPSVSRVITQQCIDAYARASGDDNPLHTDPRYAAGKRFGSTIAHGMLVLSLVEELMARGYPRAWACGGGVDVRFKQPALPGDVLQAEGTVIKAVSKPGSRQVTCEIRVAKNGSTPVLAGTAWVNIEKE